MALPWAHFVFPQQPFFCKWMTCGSCAEWGRWNPVFGFHCMIQQGHGCPGTLNLCLWERRVKRLSQKQYWSIWVSKGLANQQGLTTKQGGLWGAIPMLTSHILSSEEGDILDMIVGKSWCSTESVRKDLQDHQFSTTVIIPKSHPQVPYPHTSWTLP